MNLDLYSIKKGYILNSLILFKNNLLWVWKEKRRKVNAHYILYSPNIYIYPKLITHVGEKKVSSAIPILMFVRLLIFKITLGAS